MTENKRLLIPSSKQIKSQCELDVCRQLEILNGRFIDRVNDYFQKYDDIIKEYADVKNKGDPSLVVLFDDYASIRSLSGQIKGLAHAVRSLLPTNSIALQLAAHTVKMSNDGMLQMTKMNPTRLLSMSGIGY
jgi:hypothetical protein